MKKYIQRVIEKVDNEVYVEMLKFLNNFSIKNKCVKFLVDAIEDEAMIYDISYRGGGLGVKREYLAYHIAEDEYDYYLLLDRLPRYYGCGCNYLGGGVRGKAMPSGYGEGLEKYESFLDELSFLCCRLYDYLDNKFLVNDYMEGYVKI